MKSLLLRPLLAVSFVACSSTGKTFIAPPLADTDTGSTPALDAEDGEEDLDQDGDGWPQSQDCDDDNIAIHPGATEICNGVDDDCVGGIDDGVGPLWYMDADGDLYGGAMLGQFCDAPDGATDVDGDCADDNPEVHPDSTLLVDGQDSDCDGRKDWLLMVSAAVDDAGELCFNDEFIGDTGMWIDGRSYEVWLHSGQNTVGIYGWDVGRYITAAIVHHRDLDARSSSSSQAVCSGDASSRPGPLPANPPLLPRP